MNGIEYSCIPLLHILHPKSQTYPYPGEQEISDLRIVPVVIFFVSDHENKLKSNKATVFFLTNT